MTLGQHTEAAGWYGPAFANWQLDTRRVPNLSFTTARTALAQYQRGIEVLGDAISRDAQSVRLNLLRHKRRMNIVLGDCLAVIDGSREILALPLRLAKWVTFGCYLAMAEAYFSMGEFEASELYAYRAWVCVDTYDVDHLCVHPLNLIGDIEVLRGHREIAIAAYDAAAKVGSVGSESDQLDELWSPGWNLYY